MPLSNVLKSFRAMHGFTQEDMANTLGISKNSYNRKELGEREFTLLEAKKISDVFGKGIEEIFFNLECNTNSTN